MPGEELLIGALSEKAKSIPATALGIAQTVTGFFNKSKAKKEAERLRASRPELEASPYIEDQLSLAQNELSNGMSGATERAYEEGISRDVSSSLDAILKGGGDINNVADIFDRSATGRQRLSLMKENLRLSQINSLVNAHGVAENQRKEMFEFNEWRPWADDAQANAQARQGAENMIWGGLQTIANGATGALNSQQGQSATNSYFQSPQGGSYSPNIQSSRVQGTSMNTSGFISPGANLNYIDPNYGSSIINDSIFQ